MKESVSAIFVSKSRVYFIKRQNYLPAFPGYHAPPGGKIDADDLETPLENPIWPTQLAPKILHALMREVKEELNYDLSLGIKNEEVKAVHFLGIATSPEFNPYRFKNYYFKITLGSEVDFQVDPSEAVFGIWKTPHEFIAEFDQGKILAVPPVILFLKTLAKNLEHFREISMSPEIDLEAEVPMIEPLKGVRQFLPLSNTFPPANRTNAFIIGDENAKKILIDPSPRDEWELKKFLKALDRIGFDAILLTHHHQDHYQFSREIALKYKVGIFLSTDTFSRIGADYFSGINITFLQEGDIVTRTLGEDVIVYETPGHDEGQLGLAPRSLNWFLVGDLIQTIGTVSIVAPEGDMTKYFSSLKRIIELNPKNIIPSHGIILGGTDKLKATLQHRINREEQILKYHQEKKSDDEILEEDRK